MRLGKPTSDVPPRGRAAQGKYGKIYEAVRSLGKDEWLPVQFPSEREAFNFRVVATTNHNLEARLRGSMVYVRAKDEAKNGSRKERAK